MRARTSMLSSNSPPLVRDARPQDLSALRHLLESAHLDSTDLEESLGKLIVAEAEGVIAGMIGLEGYGSTGLLRSAAVLSPLRGRGIGRMLVEELERRARILNLEKIVLLTTDAARYFSRWGYSEIDRSALRGDIVRSRQFTGACQASATVMMKHLSPHH